MAEETKKKKKRSAGEIAMWGIMALLILGLGVGFGFDNGLAGSAGRVARVGDKDVDINTYARALQNQLNQLTEQNGRAITFEEARANGVDRIVLEQLMRERALDHEAYEMGISIGDENLRDRILDIPAFRGVDGTFNRDGYRFALQNAGLTEAEFEAQLREETARTLLQGAILTGVVMPDTFADTLVNYVGETRDFSWVRLDQSNLTEPLEEPDDATLQAYYDENIDRFQLPESKRITFVVLEPGDLIDQVEIAEEDLQAEYEARRADFNQPERRLVERLVYLDDASAEQAAAQIEVGTTFETLVEERGLTLADVDLGDVGRLELDAAGEGVFAAEVGDVVGPLPSSLGPALFRVNAVLPAQNRSFEDVRGLLQQILAADAARRLVEVQAQDYDDRLAAGATLEELAAETDMKLGTIDWFPDFGEGIAAYQRFRDVALRLTEDDFPEIESLSDGAIFAARLDEILPERAAPFEDIKLNVQGNWEAERAEGLLSTQAEALVSALEAGEDFDAQDYTVVKETELDRGAFLTGAPPDFMTEVFEMTPGDVRMMSAFGAVVVVQLDQINPASDNAEAQTLKEQLSSEMGGALARDIFGIFANDAMLRAGRDIEPNALEAVHNSFQ